MLITENKVLRNLQEQVAKNKSDISDILEAKAVIAEFGIRVVGEVDTEAELPDPATYSGEYGDAYTVGTQTPYDYYIFTRPNDDIPQAHWFNVGQFPMPGPQGEPGLPGAKGDKGSMIYVENMNPTLVTGYNIGDLWINTKDNALFQLNSKGWDRVGYIKGDTGPQGPKGDKGDTGAPGTPINIVGVLSTVDLLPNPATVNKTTAYLVGESAPYPLYVIVGELDDKNTWTWQQLAVGGGGADITANIEVASSVNDVLSAPKKKLCILSNTSNLTYKVVDKIEGGSEEMPTLSNVLPQPLSGSCCARYNNNIYIFGGENSNGRLNTIYKFNCNNETIERLSVTLPKALYGSFCSIKDDNIYIFGGYDGNYSNTIYKFNCTSETIETLSVTLPRGLSSACCTRYGNNIYIFGGYNSSIGTFKTIYKFNCNNETIETLSVTLPKSIQYACCSTYSNNIYIFGGIDSGNNYSNTIYKFNCTSETIETLSVTLPRGLSSACCTRYGNNIYIFGGKNGSNRLNTIYKFNCTNEAISILSAILPQSLSGVCCSTYSNNIYIFGGYNGSNYVNTIYNFSIAFDLLTNNVLIYNANSDYSFDLITDQVTIPISKVYIGDINNTAKLANAYLYDETQTAWVNVNTGEVLS